MWKCFTVKGLNVLLRKLHCIESYSGSFGNILGFICFITSDWTSKDFVEYSMSSLLSCNIPHEPPNSRRTGRDGGARKHIKYRVCIYFWCLLCFIAQHTIHSAIPPAPNPLTLNGGEKKIRKITANIIARYLYKITMLSNLAINIWRRNK